VHEVSLHLLSTSVKTKAAHLNTVHLMAIATDMVMVRDMYLVRTPMATASVVSVVRVVLGEGQIYPVHHLPMRMGMRVGRRRPSRSGRRRNLAKEVVVLEEKMLRAAKR